VIPRFTVFRYSLFLKLLSPSSYLPDLVFTGIIEATAKILQKTEPSLTVERPASFDDVKKGSSISVSGVCLSVVDVDAESMSFDVVPETFTKTNIAGLEVGDYVNLERALRADGRFEGHVVQGHIEGTAEVAQIRKKQSGAELVLSMREEIAAFVVPKGSIAVDGVSLTVASVEGDGCTIALIPLTLEQTTLGDLQQGDLVNIETDILGRTILTHLSRRP
jgi:riboflavin synthase